MMPPMIRRSFVLISVMMSSVLGHEGRKKVSKDDDRIKVLCYSNTAYYRHPEIPALNRFLVILGEKHGIDVDVTEHHKDLRPRELSKYDVLLLNNANQLTDLIPEAERKSVEAWFKRGGGIVGLHAALVKNDKWKWLTQLGGCDFDSDSKFMPAKVIVDTESKDHPAVSGAPAEFTYSADWTNHTRSVTGLPNFKVLLRVDESSYEPVRPYFQKKGGKAMGKDHPICWTHEPPGEGKFFYTELGHDVRSLDTKFGRQHVVEAIKWAASTKKK